MANLSSAGCLSKQVMLNIARYLIITYFICACCFTQTYPSPSQSLKSRNLHQLQTFITTIDSQEYRSVLWTRAEGLSLPKKNAMIKDVYGFLWIISPVGLNRFDGNTFKIFYPDKNTCGHYFRFLLFFTG